MNLRFTLAQTLRISGLLAVAACAPSDSDSSGSDAASPDTHPAAQVSVQFPFHDVTADSGIDFQLTSGAETPTQIPEVKGGGLALLDCDEDGRLDLFVPNGASLDAPNAGPGCRLFLGTDDLKFRDATSEAGLNFRGWGMGATAADADGDGHLDLFIAAIGPNALWLGDGQGRFEDGTQAAGLAHSAWAMTGAFGDLDLDGDLDLYLVNYLQFDFNAPPPPTSFLGVPVFAGPVGLAAERDLLYRNEGRGSFADVSSGSGCDAPPPAFGLGALIVDFDADGLQDIYVGNDSMPSYLFANQGEFTFRESGLTSGIAVDADGGAQATMGIAVADVSGNGLPDLFTTNFENDSNTLHINQGGLDFFDQTGAWRLGLISRPYLGWSALFGDYDLDGDEDLFVVNGHVYQASVTRELGTTRAQTPLLFARDGDGFTRATNQGPWLDHAACDRSAVHGDLDNDGDLDLIIGSLDQPLRVLRNDAPKSAWVTIELRDERADSHNPFGIGSQVLLRAGESLQRRWIYTGGGYISGLNPSAHFGLSASNQASKLEVEVIWPDGETSTYSDVQAGKQHRLKR